MESKPVMELTLGAKVPSSTPYAMGNAEIKVYLKEGDNFDQVLDDTKAKLEEALAAALLVADSK